VPGYLWNGTHQQLIPILPKDQSRLPENREMITETTMGSSDTLTGSQRVTLSRRRKRKDIVFVMAIAGDH